MEGLYLYQAKMKYYLEGEFISSTPCLKFLTKPKNFNQIWSHVILLSVM